MIALILAGVIGVWALTMAIILALVVGQRLPIAAYRYPLIVLYAVVLHYVWAACLIVDPRAGEATSLAWLTQVFRPELAISLLLIVATLALIYVFLFSARYPWAVLLVLPQQAVLFISAWTALTAMIEGHFADGVARPTAFIVADQAPAIIAAVLHTAAIIMGFRRQTGG